MILRDPLAQEVSVKDRVQQVGFPTPANTCDHLDKAVVFPLNELIQVVISRDFHLPRSLLKRIFATIHVFPL
jgi:hypothetical protein